MADITKVQAMLRDPEYQSLPWGERHQLLAQKDPEYAALSPRDQADVLNSLKTKDWWQPGGKVAPQPLKQPPQRPSFGQQFMAEPVSTTANVITGGLQKLIPGRQPEEQAADDFYNAAKGVLSKTWVGKQITDPNPITFASLKDIVHSNRTTTEAERNQLMTNTLGWALGGSTANSIKSAVEGMQPAVSASRQIAKSYTKIDNSINKALRPGVEGKRTAGQIADWAGRARDAVKNIVLNKNNLQLTDDFGETVTGKLPQNLRQFSQAVDQTKKNLYQRYSEMAKEAGGQGASVKLNPIANELTQISNEKVLQDLAPDAVRYAKGRASSLNKRGVYTAEDAERAIAILNKSLESFYKNPSYNTASKAYIDSLVVNNLRKGLDEAIETATGPGYQELKNAYGALKAVERDLNRRAIVDARKNAKGLLDFTDVFTGGQVINGLMHMNPGAVAAGTTSKVISALYKMRNDPNRTVKKMFETADKLVSGVNIPRVPPQAAAQAPAALPVGWGKVNTLKLPVGTPSRFDPYVGANVPSVNSLAQASRMGGADVEPYFFDKLIGAKVPRKLK